MGYSVLFMSGDPLIVFIYRITIYSHGGSVSFEIFLRTFFGDKGVKNLKSQETQEARNLLR